MSASIYYQPVNGTWLNVGGGKSSFMEAMRRAKQCDAPWVLTQGDDAMLRGLAAGLDDRDQRAAVDVLIDAIATHDTIRVWAEY